MTPFLVLIISTLAVAICENYNSKILGGHEAGPNDYPYVISVQLKFYKYHLCAGCILNERWIITAAHCFYGLIPASFLQIVAGAKDLKQVPASNVYKVSRVFKHSEYSIFKAHSNDIALVKVNRDIIFNRKVKPIKLGEADVFPGMHLTAIGWGKIRYPDMYLPNLQYIYLRSIDDKTCQKQIKELSLKSQFCTLNKAGEGVCREDDGGPVVSNDELVGIVSYYRPCAEGAPDVHTKISSFVKWIQNVTTHH